MTKSPTTPDPFRPAELLELRIDLLLIADYTQVLRDAVEHGDRTRAATALATLQQGLHITSLAVDPTRQALAELTHRHGQYVRPPEAVNADTTTPAPGTDP